MPPISPVSWPFAVCALVALPAMAQFNTPPVAPAPATETISANAAPAPTALVYPSVFEGYQPFSDEKLKPWKESNATVEKIGGWRAYAKEAAEPQAKHDHTPAASPASPATAAKASAAPADPHAGHGKH